MEIMLTPVGVLNCEKLIQSKKMIKILIESKKYKYSMYQLTDRLKEIEEQLEFNNKR